jgi:hypothetical protein
MTPGVSTPNCREEAHRVLYNADMRQWFTATIGTAIIGTLVALGTAAAQTPQPFPRPTTPQSPAPPPPATARPTQPPPAPATPAPAVDPATPSEATLGFPIYPGAQFIASYDAGRAQRYYIFGSTTAFADLVTYYRTVLKDKGNLVFENPPTHMFEVGKFNNDTMAFPPGVTIKDFTSGGSQGYANPKPGAQPARFQSVIMIVPAPPGAAAQR